MNREASRWWPVVLLAGIASLSIWLERAVNIEVPVNGPEGHTARTWVESFTVRRFDADGKLQNTLSAPRMAQFADTRSLYLEAPRLEVGRGAATTITAREADVSADAKRIDLRGDVRVERIAIQRDAPPTVLTTQAMTVFPELERAQSAAEVVITRADSRITGRGLVIDQKAGTTELGGPVHATFLPQRRS